ncbi:MAG TPA: glucuronate isomerase [Gemmatimonadaceae bacterium]|nr:glucuronate isomerase [Gemmatimonadaceae bacterium]
MSRLDNTAAPTVRPSGARSAGGGPLNPDRYFDPDPAIRTAARALFDETQRLPLICPHGHVEARLLAENEPFPEPTALIVTPDHYIYRMLYSRGVPMEALGIPTRDGTPAERDPRLVWRRFADHYYLFAGTPTAAWLDHQLSEVFGITTRLTGESALAIYDEISERLASPEFRPRALFERFNIESLSTTDGATDSLAHHRAIRDSGWTGRVIPTFRPDALLRIAAAEWRAELRALEALHGSALPTADAFTAALAQRRRYFKAQGATATDHGVLEPFTQRLSDAALQHLYARALAGDATAADQRAFEGHMLIEMARMSVDDGLVMQIHPGAWRDHNPSVAARFGPNTGADIPIATEFTRNLRPLLEAYGNDARFTLILFTLDESTYSRELAPLAGHYPAVRLGPPWWFHDSVNGLRRFREQTFETAGAWNTAGFNDDTRAFCSIPARHDLARRVDANFLGGLVARHVIDMDDARMLARALAYDVARETYKLDRTAKAGA